MLPATRVAVVMRGRKPSPRAALIVAAASLAILAAQHDRAGANRAANERPSGPEVAHAQPDCVRLTLDRARYPLGATVGFTLTNGCSDLVEMPSPAPWSIRDSEDRPVYSPSVIQVVTVVPSGSSVSWSWDQKDQQASPVGPGMYRLDLRAARANVSTTYSAHFEIWGAVPTSPPTGQPTSVPPASTATVVAGVACVCEQVRERVPIAAVNSAVAQPGRIHGWQQPVNPNVPEGPFNRLRQCLALVNPNVPYHPLHNGLVFKGGCP